jgi:hypothetical protein
MIMIIFCFLKGGIGMGLYLNPGKERFDRALNSDIYVDKSELISFTNSIINTERQYICVSRPRRFGKSITANMLAAYYGRISDSREMFMPLKIAQDASFEEHLNRYDVIYLDIQLMLARAESLTNLFKYMTNRVVGELRDVYGELFSADVSNLSEAIDLIYSAGGYQGKGFVFIVDEWDCIFREAKGNQEAQRAYLDFLKGLWKGSSCVKLVYMTGILPIKKYGTHSALNIFKEYSMTDPKQLTEFTGFTVDEVKMLCDQYHMDYNEAKRWYDGYVFYGAEHIYNPKSVVDAMLDRTFQSYWTATETYEALKVYIDMNYEGLKDDIVMLLGDGRCKVNPRRFQNDMTTFGGKDDVLTLLIHLGYLAYDSENEEVYIPNYEIKQEFVDAIEGDEWGEVIKTLSASQELLEATWQLDGEAVAKGIGAAHMEAASILNYNNENALSCVINLAYFSAKREYFMIREFPTGKGFADVVFLPRKKSDKPAIVVELKWNHSAEGAITQIKSRNYGESLKDYAGEVLLVGINYDKESKEHQCVIERVRKEC